VTADGTSTGGSTSASALPSASASAPLRRADRRYPGYLLDLDGTVYLGTEPLPGAVEAFDRLRGAGSRVIFLSNNPLQRSASYAAKLRGMGLAVDDDDVVSSIDALLAYLGPLPRRRVLPICEPLLETDLRDAGHELTDDPRRAEVVIVSWDRGFTYDKLHRAFVAVRNGAPIVATNADPFCPTPDGGLPDCGAILAAIEVASGARAEAVVGKPSRHMSAVALDRIGLRASDVVMVGDRLSTDVAMAREAGMVSALVLTGATSSADLGVGGLVPDLVLDRLDDLIPTDVAGSSA
jgi:HAD superfamily hydrolase (TIGR01450 family)